MKILFLEYVEGEEEWEKKRKKWYEGEDRGGGNAGEEEEEEKGEGERGKTSLKTNIKNHPFLKP